ncbi:MAG: hypothetical protein ABIO40_08300 [Devosia sp.]
MADDAFREPIVTLEQARAFFVAMGCSAFHMSREYPDRYEEFQRLKVPDQIQAEWRLQQFEETRGRILKAPADHRWHLFSSMIAVCDWSKAALDDLLDTARALLPDLPANETVLVAESLLARNALHARSGPVLRAYDQGYPELAQQLLVVVGQLLERAAPDTAYMTIERIEAARERMKDTASLVQRLHRPSRLSRIRP